MIIEAAQTLISAYGDARAALSAAQERLALFPEPDVLLARVRLAEQDGLAWLEGEDFMPDQLATDYGFSRRAWRQWPFAFVRAFERPLPASLQPPGAATVTQWLDGADRSPVATPADQALPLASDRLTAWERRTRAPARTLPPLVAAADLAAEFVRTAPLVAGNPVIGVMLAERHAMGDSNLSAGGIVAIGMKQRQTPWLRLCAGTGPDDAGFGDDDAHDLSESGRAVRCRLAWLNAASTGAATVVRLDKRLRLWLSGLDAACAGTRRNSHLRKVALLAARGPSLTATRAAQELGLSRQAATLLIAQGCERRLLREITHGNAFRRYVIAL